ncbi:MAG: DUF2268 domain-containing putative Zn-dependent protease [Patescibacteria group bacterium]|jgi:hypothetical protein
MSVRIHILSSSPALKRYEPRLRKISQSAVKRIERFLSLKNIDIVLYDNPDDTIPEVGGIGGYTPNAHTVLISLNPHHPKFSQAIDRELSATLAHEIHHAIRWRNPGYGTTLLEALITEGLADHFSIEVGSVTKPPPWSRALNDKEIPKLLKRAKPLFNRSYNHADWFFGSKKNRLPRWTGYSLGYYLVGKYLKTHPQKKPSKLVSVKATMILE